MGRLAIWTYAHFAVDFGCFYVLNAGLKNFLGGNLETLAAGFLAYNVIAFGLQSVIGAICDERQVWRRVSGFAGSMMVCLAVVTAAVSEGAVVWAAMVTVALGNAFFHVGGGIDVLRRSGGRMSGSGIFVSSGAMGVALGSLYRSGVVTVLLMLTAVVLTGMLARHDMREQAEGDNYVHFGIVKEGSFVLMVVLLMTAVFVRSYAGSVMPMEWEKTGWLAVAPAAASCLGKALGGTAADRFGAARCAVVSLLFSAPLIILGAANVLCSLAGILLFNMTMPVTLCGLASLMPRNPGFAFGLTTLALLTGVGITYFWAMPAAAVKPAVAVMIGVAALCTGRACNNERRKEYEK